MFLRGFFRRQLKKNERFRINDIEPDKKITKAQKKELHDLHRRLEVLEKKEKAKHSEGDQPRLRK